MQLAEDYILLQCRHDALEGGSLVQLIVLRAL